MVVPIEMVPQEVSIDHPIEETKEQEATIEAITKEQETSTESMIKEQEPITEVMIKE